MPLNSPRKASRSSLPVAGKGFCFSWTRLFVPLLATLLVLAGPPIPDAQAKVTEISQFTTHIMVRSDATLMVREWIAFRCETGSRPVERSFPLVYASQNQSRIHLIPDILEVKLDGVPVPYHFREDAQANVLILEKNTLSSGNHELELAYVVDRQLAFDRRSVELYWPVTGYDWEIPIHQAEARVELPLLVNILDQRGFTGPELTYGDEYTMGVDTGGVPWFKTTRRIYPGDGLAIRVRWPKGFVAEPWLITRFWHGLGDNLGFILALAGLLLMAMGQLRAWRRMGVDVSIPHVSAKPPSPPDFLSPAALRAGLKRSLDTRALAATLISLATRNAIKLYKDSGYLLLARTDCDLDTLKGADRGVCKALFETAGTDVAVELPAVSRTGIRSLRGAYQAMRSGAAREARLLKLRFLLARMSPGLFMGILVLSGLIWSADRSGLAAFLLSWLLASHVMLLILFMAIFNPDSPNTGRNKGLISLATIPFVAFEGTILVFFSQMVTWSAGLVAALVIVLNTLYFSALRRHWLRRGPYGARIARFKARLLAGYPDDESTTTTSDHCLGPDTESFPGASSLPYAIVMDMDAQWDRFFRLTGSCTLAPSGNLRYLLERLCDEGGSGLCSELEQAIGVNPPDEVLEQEHKTTPSENSTPA